MPITFTIDNQNSQTLALIEYLKTLSFVKFTETVSPLTKEMTTTVNEQATDDLEEDEYGIPIKYRDKIMELSQKTNKAIAKRWDETLSRRNETVEI